MSKIPSSHVVETEQEYRAIEATLLGTARGRWFLAEHGRRARRLDSAMLEDAIARLTTSLRQPPALLGQLKGELEEVTAFINETRTSLTKAPTVAAEAEPGAAESEPQAEGGTEQVKDLMRAAEDIHELAWNMQSQAPDPASFEAIGRIASRMYAMSHKQAVESQRILAAAGALDAVIEKVAAVLETVEHELVVDAPEVGKAASVLDVIASARPSEDGLVMETATQPEDAPIVGPEAMDAPAAAFSEPEVAVEQAAG